MHRMKRCNSTRKDTPSAMEDAPYRPPRAPNGLGSEGKKIWRDIAAEFELESPDDLALLLLVAEARDTVARCRRVLSERGDVWTDRLGNIRPRPEVDREHKAASRIASLIGQLTRQDIADERLRLALARQARVQARQDATHGQPRDRRGGGQRRVAR